MATKTLEREGVHLYVSKVKPALKDKTDDGKKFYDVWFILEDNGVNKGSVLKARCICKGGRDGGCKHISAAMYPLKDLLNTRSEDSVTSGTCRWLKRPTSSSKPCEAKHLKIAKRNPSLKRKRKNTHAYCDNIDIDVRHVDDRSEPTHESLVLFTQSLSRKPVPKPPLILPILEKMYGPSKEPEERSLQNQSIDNVQVPFAILEYSFTFSRMR